MAKHNIKLLQNSTDFAYLVNSVSNTNTSTSFDKDYYIQALANLGQRVGIKGDGVEYKSFTFADALGISEDTFSSSNYIGVIKYSTKDNRQYAICGVTDKGSIYNELSSSTYYNINTYNIFNKFYLDYDLSFDVTINNINKYKTNSILYNDGTSFISALYGHILGTEQTDYGSCEIQYTKINVEDASLNSAIRIFNLYDNYYAMIVITTETFGNYSYTMRLYTLDLDNIADEELSDATKQYFKESLRYSSCTNADNPFFFLNNDIDVTSATIDELLSYADDAELWKTSIFGMFVKYSQYRDITDTSFVLPIDVNSTKDNYLSIPDVAASYAAFNNIDEILQNDLMGMYQRITAINNDIEYTYYNLLNKFSTVYFNQNQQTMTSRVLLSLYEKLYYDTIYERSEMDEEDYFVLYIPLNFTFNYLCNSVNNLKIYYSNELYVTFIDSTTMSADEINDMFIDNTGLILDYRGEEKIRIYDVYVDYDSVYEDFADDITVANRYTLPYINSENNWQINDINTNISAIGKDAGHPNIVIVNSKNDFDVNSDVSSVTTSDILQEVEWDAQSFTVNTNSLYDAQNEGSVTCLAYVPVNLTKDQTYELSDTLLINISSTELCDNADEQQYNTSFTSLWRLVNEYDDEGNLNANFQYIETEDGEAYDFSNMMSLRSILVNLINNDKLLTQNVFDLAALTMKTTVYSGETSDANDIENKYFLFKQKPDNEFINYDTSFRNNLVLEVQCNSESSVKENNTETKITDVTYDNYTYWLTEALANNYSTSKIYVKEQPCIGVVTTESTTYENKTLSTNVSYNETYITSENITVDTAVKQSVFDAITNVLTYTYTYYVPVQYQNEYVLSNNVPTLDMSEVLLQNSNTVNRVNIVSIGENAAYNSYIGTSFDINNKSALIIGTSNENINLGSETLVDPRTESYLNSQYAVKVNFDKIELNGNLCKVNNALVQSQTIGGVTYYTSRMRPIGKYSAYNLHLQYNDESKLYTIYNTASTELQNIVDSQLHLNEQTLQRDIDDEALFKIAWTSDTDNNNVTKLSTMMSVNNLFKLKFDIDISLLPVSITHNGKVVDNCNISDSLSNVIAVTLFNNSLKYRSDQTIATQDIAAFEYFIPIKDNYKLADNENVKYQPVKIYDYINIVWYVDKHKLYIIIDDDNQLTDFTFGTIIRTQHAGNPINYVYFQKSQTTAPENYLGWTTENIQYLYNSVEDFYKD